MMPKFVSALPGLVLAFASLTCAHAEPASLAQWQEPAAKAAAAAANQGSRPEKSAPAAEAGAGALGAGPAIGAQKGAAQAATPAAAPVPAKKLFGAIKAPVSLKARAIGSYAKGCLAGATSLAVDGPEWQAMRLSRNRVWGHPRLIALIERFAGEAKAKDGWPGLLVGDISQPRGGPMLTGHASHQVGLDADIWFTPMPPRRLTRTERENLAATSMLAPDSLSVNRTVWGSGQEKIVKRVASYPEVERVLVHPAIKKALCQSSKPEDKPWLAKVRPYFGHFYHFHVRIGCPPDSPGCTRQASIPGDDGCGKELDDWFKLLTAPPKPKPAEPVKPVKPKPPLTLADLPPECGDVLAGPAQEETASAKLPAAAAAKSEEASADR